MNEVAQLRVDSLGILEPCKDDSQYLSMGQTDPAAIWVEIVLGPLKTHNSIIETGVVNETSVSGAGMGT